VRDPVSGEGLLVEHEGESEQKVRRDIDQSLRALMGNRGVDWPEVRSAVVGATCTREPVCAFVVAAYESASWGSA
jgi:arginine decarboxylase